MVDFTLQISKLKSGKLSGLTKTKILCPFQKKKKNSFSVRSDLTESQVCLVTVFPLPIREETTMEGLGFIKLTFIDHFYCARSCAYILLSLPNPVKLVLLLTFYYVEISTEED